MEIRSDRRHQFSVGPEDLWAALTQVEAYQEWWPWLRSFNADSFETGAIWSAVVQPPLPYRLRFQLHLGTVESQRLVTADVTGDITGSARLEISRTSTGSELHLASRLTPTNTLLRAVARVARPMAHFGHEWVLNTGLRQFRDRALR